MTPANGHSRTATGRASSAVGVGRTPVDCPECGLPVWLTIPDTVLGTSGAERAVVNASHALRLHLTRGCTG